MAHCRCCGHSFLHSTAGHLDLHSSSKTSRTHTCVVYMCMGVEVRSRARWIGTMIAIFQNRHYQL